MYNLFKKTFSAAITATALTASVVVPVAVSPAEAATTLKVSDYIVQAKDGNFYTLDLPTYLDLKVGKVPFLNEVKVTHVKTSNDKMFPLDLYVDAKGSMVGGTMNTALQALDKYEKPVEVEVGKVVVDDKGNIELEKPPTAELFQVISID